MVGVRRGDIVHGRGDLHRVAAHVGRQRVGLHLEMVQVIGRQRHAADIERDSDALPRVPPAKQHLALIEPRRRPARMEAKPESPGAGRVEDQFAFGALPGQCVEIDRRPGQVRRRRALHAQVSGRKEIRRERRLLRQAHPHRTRAVPNADVQGDALVLIDADDAAQL
jgi:hypothetical protein